MTQSRVPLPPKPPFRERWRIAGLPWLTITASYAFLFWLAPFKLGLASLALYIAPTVLTACTANAVRMAANDHDAHPTLRRRTIILVGFLALIALTGTFQAMLTNYALSPKGIPSQAYLQVINVPAGYLDPNYSFSWDPRKHQSNAFYNSGEFLNFNGDWAETETVRGGNANPCTPMMYPYNVGAGSDNYFHATARCDKVGPGIWRIFPKNDGGYEVAFARKTDGVTIQLAGDINDESALRRAITGAHEATGMELWHRSPWLLALLK